MHREARLITEIIKKLNLDLRGLNILTEVGSGPFFITPIIAVMAGAEKVYAWTKDSEYGRGDEIISNCIEKCNLYGISKNSIEYSNNLRPVRHIEDADIITNLGFIRPLDVDFLSFIKKNSVISYMCEAWEFRDTDIDLNYCRKHGIKVAGTWENKEGLRIFDGVGYLAAKICFEAGFEIYQNNIVIISNDQFGQAIKRAFDNMGANKVFVIKPVELNISQQLKVDFIILADYVESVNIFTDNIINFLLENDISVVHLAGNIDFHYLDSKGVYVYPKKSGANHRMTFTLAHLGLKPLIDLHAAGLKVGEELIKNNLSNLSQILC